MCAGPDLKGGLSPTDVLTSLCVLLCGLCMVVVGNGWRRLVGVCCFWLCMVVSIRCFVLLFVVASCCDWLSLVMYGCLGCVWCPGCLWLCLIVFGCSKFMCQHCSRRFFFYKLIGWFAQICKSSLVHMSMYEYVFTYISIFVRVQFAVSTLSTQSICGLDM